MKKNTILFTFLVDISALFIKRCRLFKVIFLYNVKKGQRTLYSETTKALTLWAEVFMPLTSGGQVPV